MYKSVNFSNKAFIFKCHLSLSMIEAKLEFLKHHK